MIGISTVCAVVKSGLSGTLRSHEAITLVIISAIPKSLILAIYMILFIFTVSSLYTNRKKLYGHFVVNTLRI